MKKTLLSMAFLLTGMGQAMAASSVDLSVTGLITPAACTPSLSAGGVVDHGKISHEDLDFYKPIALPVATLQLSVNCTAATLFAVKSTDNRDGTSAADGGGLSSFGVGIVNGVKIGWYTLGMSNGLADGVVKPVIESVDGRLWMDAHDESQIWQPNWMRAFNGASAGPAAPLPVQAMAVDVVVRTHLINKQTMPGGLEVPIDGSATLDVVYL